MASNRNLAVALAVSLLLSAVIISDSASAPSPSPYPSAAAPKSFISQSPSSSIAASPEQSSAPAPEPSEPSEASDLLDFSLDHSGEPEDDSDEVGYMPVKPKAPVTVAEEQEISKFLIATTTSAADKIENFVKDEITKRIEAAKDDEDVKKCVKLCGEVYGDASVDIKGVIEDVKGKVWRKASADTSKFMNDIEACSDCFWEIEVVDNQFEEVAEWASGVGRETLLKLSKF